MTLPVVRESGVSPDGTVVQPVGGWGLPLLVLIVGSFMSVLDTSIVNVAIPTIQKEFGGTTQDVQWVLTGYTLMLGVVVPATAWLGNRFGLSRLYTVALLLFAAGSALCGLAWDLNSLVIFRLVQAIPGGILPVVTLTILFKIVPRDRVGAAMGLYGLGVVFAPAIGPSLGGYLVEYVDWRLIFYINVPIGILGAVAAVLVLPSFPRRVGQPFDALGFVTIAGGLFALLLPLSKGGSEAGWEWSSYRILGLFTLSALLLALFVVIELEVANPLLDIRIFRTGQFTLSMGLIAIVVVMMFGMLFYIPLYLQQTQGLGAFNSGLALLPQGLAMGLLMPITGRIYDRIGPRWLVVIGLVIAAVATYRLHTLALDTPREHVAWLLVPLGVGLGISTMPIFTSGLAAIPAAQSDIASVFNNVVRNAAGALGIAGLTVIMTIQQAQQYAGRTALLPRNTPIPIPNLGPPGTPARTSHWPLPIPHVPPEPTKWFPIPPTGPSGPPWLSLWAPYNRTQNLVFVGAMDDLFLVSAALGALAVVMAALFMPSRPTPATPTGPAPPAQEAAPTTAETTADRQLAPAAGGQTRTASEQEQSVRQESGDRG
jgi:EmrB/QacA subfamily drug resistance transporter